MRVVNDLTLFNTLSALEIVAQCIIHIKRALLDISNMRVTFRPLGVRLLIGFRVECIYIKLDFAQSQG